MSTKVFFIGDLHLGHNKIVDFSKDYRESSSLEAHDAWIISQWNSVVSKRDVVYILGDIAFSRNGLQQVTQLNGIKKMVYGNHDGFKIPEYEAVGLKIIGGLIKYKEFWLSHAPIHTDELRGRYNIHGHVHHKTLPDKRYINVSVENINGVPMCLKDVRATYQTKEN